MSLVVVDYITLMAGDGENETIRIGNISRGLKLLARDLDVPVIAISQLNRSVEHRSDKRPTMADFTPEWFGVRCRFNHVYLSG